MSTDQNNKKKKKDKKSQDTIELSFFPKSGFTPKIRAQLAQLSPAQPDFTIFSRVTDDITKIRLHADQLPSIGLREAEDLEQ